MFKKILPLFCLVCVLALTGCDEQALLNYLQSYGVQVKGHDVTLQDVRSFLASEDAKALDALSDSSETTDTTTTALSDCSELTTASPRGLSCMQCMQDGAYSQAMALAIILKRSCLKNIAINYLVDGTFSFDGELLFKHINLLTENGRTPFIYFYVTNGPTQRLWKSTPVNALGTKISPERFRYNVLHDAQTQEQYKKLVTRLVPFIQYAQQKGAVVSILPALEDNLSDEAYNKLQELTLEAIPQDTYVAIGRNACVGCYAGNEGDTSTAAFQEKHIRNAQFWVSDGVVTNDGKDFSLSPSEDAFDSSVQTVKDMMSRAKDLNDTFILWDAERQGITTERSSMLVAPANRSYPVPDFRDRLTLIDLLRSGLDTTTTTESD